MFVTKHQGFSTMKIIRDYVISAGYHLGFARPSPQILPNPASLSEAQDQGEQELAERMHQRIPFDMAPDKVLC